MLPYRLITAGSDKFWQWPCPEISSREANSGVGSIYVEWMGHGERLIRLEIFRNREEADKEILRMDSGIYGCRRAIYSGTSVLDVRKW